MVTIISNGKPPKIPVPNVIGLSQGMATFRLTHHKLTVQVTQVDVTDKKMDGIVVSESPAPGTQVKQDRFELCALHLCFRLFGRRCCS